MPPYWIFFWTWEAVYYDAWWVVMRLSVSANLQKYLEGIIPLLLAVLELSSESSDYQSEIRTNTCRKQPYDANCAFVTRVQEAVKSNRFGLSFSFILSGNRKIISSLYLLFLFSTSQFPRPVSSSWTVPPIQCIINQRPWPVDPPEYRRIGKWDNSFVNFFSRLNSKRIRLNLIRLLNELIIRGWA